MNKIKENEIRRLLNLYYEGKTSRAEERQLEMLLSSADYLPDDLEAERHIFNLMSDGADLDIPDNIDMRITNALEKEIASGRSGSPWRRRLIIAASAASVIILAFIGICILLSPDNGGNNSPLLTEKEIYPSQNDKTLPDSSISHAGLAAADINNLKHAELKNDGSNSPTAENNQHDRTVKKSATRDKHNASCPKKDNVYLSLEEERLLEEDNYRVVSDEREAFAIVNSVFARLNGNLIENDYRINDINDEYARVINVGL